MANRELIREGMTVYSSDGEKLGKVVALGTTEFQVEKGFFFPKDTVLTYSEIQDVRGSDVIVAHGKSLLEERHGSTRATTGLSDTTTSRDGDVRVQLAEEQLDVVKRERSAGDVKIHKHVETETKTIDVPVRKESVSVERVAAGPNTQPDGSSFKDQTVSIPVVEEEIEVTKRPVVREEIRVNKEAWQEERRVADTVRREEADIEGEDSAKIGVRDPNDPSRY